MTTSAPAARCFAIAGLLVASVPVVAIVLENEQAQAAGEIDGLIAAVVVDQNADVDQIGQFSDGDLERLLRVVGGHDDRDAFAVDHGARMMRVTDSLPEISGSGSDVFRGAPKS